MDTDFDSIVTLREWTKRVRGTFGHRFSPSQAFAEWILRMDNALMADMRNLGESPFGASLKRCVDGINAVRATCPHADSLQDQSQPLTGTNGVLPALARDLEDAVGRLAPITTAPGTTTQELSNIATQMAQLEVGTRLDKFGLRDTVFTGPLSLSLNPSANVAAAEAAVLQTLDLAGQIGRLTNAHQKQVLLKSCDPQRFQQLQQAGAALQESLKRAQDQQGAFYQTAGIDPDQWEATASGIQLKLSGRPGPSTVDKPPPVG